jgi:hypothetical protein
LYHLEYCQVFRQFSKSTALDSVLHQRIGKWSADCLKINGQTCASESQASEDVNESLTSLGCCSGLGWQASLSGGGDTPMLE